MSASPREIVGARIAAAMVAMVEQAAKDAGMWPMNPRQRAAVDTMREMVTRTAVGIPDDGIARLLSAPPGGIEAFIRSEIEPGFRREIAGGFLS